MTHSISLFDNVDASDQSVEASYAYDEFGNLVAESGTLDQPYRFSTKRYYNGIGLSYYGYRFYSAGLGRWMSRDPLGEAGGLNLYAAMGNSTLNYVDPFGLDPNNDILRCHVCPHNDPTENAIGGLIVGGPPIAMLGVAVFPSELATLIGMKVATSPTALALMEMLGNEVGGVRLSKCPNPGGKLGGPLHRATVKELMDLLESLGYKVKTEEGYKIANGITNTRYVDLSVVSPSGRTTVVQVGVQLKNGLPVSRERLAIQDLRSVQEIESIFFYPFK